MCFQNRTVAPFRLYPEPEKHSNQNSTDKPAMKFLIAEDDEDSCVFLSILLKNAGHEVLTAPDGKIALKLAQDSAPDIVITDILMPEMDGYSLCQHIKSDPKLADIPVIFYTSTYTKPDEKKLGLVMGASRFIIKPQEPNKLIEIINDVIKEHETRDFSVPERTKEFSGSLTSWHEEVLVRKLQKKVSDLEKEKEELFISREKYRDLIESLSKDFIFFSYNLQGKLVYLSPSVRNIFGYSEEEFLDHYDELYTENNRKQTIEHWMKKSPQNKEQTQFEVDFSDKSGNLHYMEIKEVPIYDPEQKLIAIDGVAQDITQRKKSEAVIRKLYQGIQQVPTAVIITDTEGNIEYANPQFSEMSGYSHNEVLGANTQIFKSGEQPQEFYKNLWKTINAGKTWHGEFHNKRKNGEFYWKQSTIAPVSRKGEIVNFIDFGEDVTEKKANEELLDKTRVQLATSEKLASIGQLAAGVSHEVLNPLNIISVQVQMMQAKVKENPLVQKYCGTMTHEIERITKILGALLSFSRKGESKKTKFLMKDIVDEVLDLFQQTFSLENITIETEFGKPIPELFADKEKIRQVFLNIISNAKHAIPEGGVISIKSQKKDTIEGTFTHISISDTGTGIKSENLSQIFDPFFTTKREGEGTGMGLAVVHGIIEDQGGTITVESEEGKGTTFSINLPA